MSTKRLIILLIFALASAPAIAQLDTVHWLPPMHARDDWGPQYLYLSTPEPQPFDVTVRDGAGALVVTATISNAQPFIHLLGSTTNTPLLVIESALHKPLTSKGLVINGPKPFYAYFRTHASTQRHAGDLTCKGQAALGKTFRIGHLLQAVDDADRRSNFIGVLATEDDTQVFLSDYDPATKFRVNGVETSLPSPVTVTLQKGESVVFSQYIQASAQAQPPNGFMGTLLKSTKPVAVNCGSWLGAPVVFIAYDIGIDQIVPVELVGKEYILCRGNGSDVLEHPIVVAHSDNTSVYLHGSSTPSIVLDAGEFFSVPTSNYSAEGNLYIRTSEPVYLYQMVGGTSIGDDENRTAGLIFVPPLSCGIPNTVDNIYLPNQIGSMSFQGGMMITAMRDSSVVLTVDGVVEPLGAAASVLGNPDFVTYRPLNLFGLSETPELVRVKAQGAVQVGLFGRNEPASFAGFFSGFTKTSKPEIELTLLGDGVCPDTLVANGRFDGVQWMLEDSILQYGPDTFLITYTPGRYRAIGYLGVCRKNEIASDTVVAAFNSPAFPYTFQPPSCYGFADGSVSFGEPYGGLAPYQYSVDGGLHFSTDPEVGQLVSGNYALVAKDSTGCYNRPLDQFIGQPDSFSVKIVPFNVPEPLYPGDLAVFKGVPDRPIILAEWEPEDATLCPDCLLYTLKAEQSTWLVLRVLDEAGCPAEDRVLVEVRPNVYAPNVIKPDSELENEAFTLYSKSDLNVRRMSVYDRWGNMVFEQRDFQTNNRSLGWDGTFRGNAMNPGVFVWMAEVEVNTGLWVVLRGDLTLIR